MFKNMSLKFRVITLLAPIMAGLIITGATLTYRFWDTNYDYLGLRDSSVFIKAVSDIVHEAQIERGKSVLYVNQKISKDELEIQRKKVDEKYAVAQPLIDKLIVSADQIKHINEYMKYIEKARGSVDSGEKAPEVAKAYTFWIGKLIASEVLAIRGTHAEGEEAEILAIPVVEVVKEVLGQYRATFGRVAGENKISTLEEVSALQNARASIISAISSPMLYIEINTPEIAKHVLTHPGWVELEKYYSEVNENFNKGKININSSVVFNKTTEVMTSLHKEMYDELGQVLIHINDKAAAANRQFWFSLVILLSALVAVSLYTYWTVKDIVGRLNKVVHELGDGSEQVASATVEISSASTELSASATEQAAALQETVASIDEVSAMVSKNADNAKRSLEVASGSNEGAKRGQQAIEEMIVAIEDIAKSNNEISRQVEQSNDQLGEIVNVITEIGNKTKIINDIVFQTKLLSFNASVEAARAGEHGKGFAVVAEEVGNLAQMSGNAAKEIGQMLETSIQRVQSLVTETKTKVEKLVQSGKEKVQTGTTVAKRCGEALENIVTGVEEVNVMVTEISTASQEQAQGVSEIGKAMTQMDQVTQQNTAAAQNTASAAEQLSKQAENLRSMVGILTSVIQGEVNRHVRNNSQGAKVIAMPKKAENKSQPDISMKKAVGASEPLPSSDDPRFEDI